MDWMEFYNKNADFKRYVDRYTKMYGVSVEEAVQHRLVQSAGEQYAEQAALKVDCQENSFERFQQHITSRFEEVQ